MVVPLGVVQTGDGNAPVQPWPDASRQGGGCGGGRARRPELGERAVFPADAVTLEDEVREPQELQAQEEKRQASGQRAAPAVADGLWARRLHLPKTFL